MNKATNDFIVKMFADKSYVDATYEELVEAGTILYTQNERGNTALILAVAKEAIGIVRELIRTGADLDIKNNNGSNVLDIATENGQDNIVKLIQSHMKRQAEQQDQYIFDLNI